MKKEKFFGWGSIFAGLIILGVQNLSATGAAISASTHSTSLISILAIITMALGALVLIKKK